MRIINTIGQLRTALRRARNKNKTIGFVPTMGAFHEGHLSLMRRCRRDNTLAVISIFVNPTQFGPGEDYRNYPRNKKNDIFLAKQENIDIIFYPSVKSIYPGRYLTLIQIKDIADSLCGRSRPGHFQGVATVVAKLLNIVEPDVMYLGQKDAQQCVVLQQMVRDLNIPTAIRVLPTVRERDGLALSSRNQYLTAVERRQAPVLYQSLRLAKSSILRGNRSAANIRKRIQKHIAAHSTAKIDYVACVDARTLKPLTVLKGKVLIALAAWFGRARLIDNVTVHVPS